MTDQPSSSKFEFLGDLAETPLPEILVTIHRYRAPGLIECSRGSEIKRIFIEDGNIIFATSSVVADSLGDRLLGRGLITREQYEESVRLLAGKTKRQGVILVEMRAIQPKELFVEVREQVQAIVWSIFDWESGSVSFQAGRERHTEFIKLAIPIPRAILQGVRSMNDAKRLVARIGTKATVLERASEDPDPDLKLVPDEEVLLASVNGKTALSELINTPPHPPALNAKLLYGLFALRLIKVKERIKIQVSTTGSRMG